MSRLKTSTCIHIHIKNTHILYRKYLYIYIYVIYHNNRYLHTRDRVHIRPYPSSASVAALWSKLPPPRHNTVECTTIRFRVPQTVADMFSADRPRDRCSIYVVVHVSSDDVLALNHAMMEPGRKLLKSNPKSAAASTIVFDVPSPQSKSLFFYIYSPLHPHKISCTKM